MKALLLALLLASADGTYMPPESNIIDEQGRVWTYKQEACRADDPLCIDAHLVAYCGGVVYARRTLDFKWYRGTAGVGWTLVGPDNPCEGK